MLMRIVLFVVFCVAIVSVIVGSLSPQLAPPSGHVIDKMIHASAYFSLTCLGYVIFTGTRTRWALVCFLFGLGATIEVLQRVIGGREASVWDQLGNSAGIVLAMIGMKLVGNRVAILLFPATAKSGDD